VPLQKSLFTYNGAAEVYFKHMKGLEPGKMANDSILFFGMT
jgi:hypothetical protein